MSEIRLLQEFCQILQGGRHKLSGNDFVAEGYPSYGAGGLNGFLPTFEFDEPAVVLSSIGARCGKCFFVEGQWNSLANTQVIRPDLSRCDPKFLWFQLNNESRWPRAGTGQPFIKPSDVKTHKVYLPSLGEQRRIAAILEQADALRAKRREALAQLDSLTQSIFIEMFGDPAVNPMKWPEVQLKNILAMSLRNGLSPSNSGGVFANVLTLSAITGNQFDSNALKKSTFNSTPPQHQSVNEHDFLICRGNGNVRLVGKGYFPPSSMEDVTFPDTMIAARIDLNFIGREYLQHLWHTDAVRRQIEASARTTNGTFKVNQTMLEELTFMLPSLPRQKLFATRIQSVEALKVSYRAALQELDRLFASLQHRAFQGEL